MVLLFSVFFSITTTAHRGSPAEIDTCRIQVGQEVIHFTAYTAQTGGTGFCQSIPVVDLTDLVFDYEGQKLRHTTVEFEITKEPQGDRIFFQKPKKIKRGTVDAKIDFGKFGAGNYLAHIAIVYEGERLDSHLPFSVGLDESSDLPTFVIILLSILAIVFIGMIAMSRSKKSS